MAATLQNHSLVCSPRGGMYIKFANKFWEYEGVWIFMQDMIKFGHSTREYVLLHAQSNA